MGAGLHGLLQIVRHQVKEWEKSRSSQVSSNSPFQNPRSATGTQAGYGLGGRVCVRGMRRASIGSRINFDPAMAVFSYAAFRQDMVWVGGVRWACAD